MEQPSCDPELSEAVEAWQAGRDGGSTPLRAAARVLTGVSHYFAAEFIDELDRRASQDPVALRRAGVLLSALQRAEVLSVDDWRAVTGTEGEGHAARGIASKPQVDNQIEQLLTADRATISMPLWGFSLSEDVARSFGDRFLFRLSGRFAAVPAWVNSGVKDDERELIGGGHYTVAGTWQDGHTTVVELVHTCTFVPLGQLAP